MLATTAVSPPREAFRGVPAEPSRGVVLPASPEAISGERVVITAEPGAVIIVGGDQFVGPLVLIASDEGLVLTETMSPESYPLGIREVPFAWPDEALKAQAVAARTYLAFTLAGGRTATGSRYGYDICATTACQVYAGRFGLDTFDGQRFFIRGMTSGAVKG